MTVAELIQKLSLVPGSSRVVVRADFWPERVEDIIGAHDIVQVRDHLGVVSIQICGLDPSRTGAV